MRESTIEKEVCEYAKAAGWLVRKFTSPNRRSVPDRIFLKGGLAFFIEFKAPGKKLTPLQAREHEILKAKDCVVYVCDDTQQGREIIEDMGITFI